MIVTADHIRAYRENGYVRVPAVFSHAEVDRVRAMVFRLYRRFAHEMPPDMDDVAEPWNSTQWDNAMVALRASEPKAFGALYDCAQASLELLSLMTRPNALEVAARLLETATEDMSFSGLMLRMDVPQDRRNVLTWHQDHAYYPQNYNDGGRGLVYWVALQDVTEEMGALHICPGSQREGLLVPETTDKQDYVTTEQRAVPSDRVARYPEVRGVCSKGDVLMMHMDTFHRSGLNISDRIRFSAIFRFHKMMADDYVPFGLLYQYNPYMIERAKRTALDESRVVVPPVHASD